MEKINSTHQVLVVPVKLENHPNADSLSIVRVFGGYPVCVRTEDWRNQSLGAYIPPDSLVKVSLSEFSFLEKQANAEGYARIRAIKLRGCVSMGLLVPAPPDTNEGDDVTELLGVKHYEPPVMNHVIHGDSIKGPEGYFPKYDIDSMRKYHYLFEEGEPVYVSEKLHGAFMRCVYKEKSINKDIPRNEWTEFDGDMFVGSRSQWKKGNYKIRKEGKKNLYWTAYYNTPEIEKFCKDYPNYVLCGEVYGQVQNLKYGTKPGEIRFAAFDIRTSDDENRWLNPNEFIDLTKQYNIPRVPLIGESIPFNLETIEELSNGRSLIEDANHHREGCVVKPLIERRSDEIGRVFLKMVGSDYLSKK